MAHHGGDDQHALVPYTGEYCPQDTRMANLSTSSESNGEGHGRNGPIVTFPAENVAIPITYLGDRPPPRFFAYAPAFHWHVHVHPTVDQAAREIIERIAHDAHAFGVMEDHRHHQLKADIEALQSQAADVPKQIQERLN